MLDLDTGVWLSSAYFYSHDKSHTHLEGCWLLAWTTPRPHGNITLKSSVVSTSFNYDISGTISFFKEGPTYLLSGHSGIHRQLTFT